MKMVPQLNLKTLYNQDQILVIKTLSVIQEELHTVEIEVEVVVELSQITTTKTRTEREMIIYLAELRMTNSQKKTVTSNVISLKQTKKDISNPKEFQEEEVLKRKKSSM